MPKNISTGAPLWKWPLVLERYDRTPSLSCFELIALESWTGTSSTRNDLRKSLPRLYRPLEDVKNMSTQSNWPSGLSRAQTLILLEMKRTRLCYWAWDQAKWLNLFSRLSPGLNTPLYLVAVAYLLGDFRLVHRVTCHYFYLSSLAQFVFGKGLFWQECKRLHQALQDIGYGKINLKNNFPSVVAAIMLENRNPYLESFTAELLERTRQNYTRQSRSVGKVSRGLTALGILPKPLRMRSYVPWKEKSTTGIAPEWADYCRRWRETSTLQPQTREGNYSFTLRTGLWLARNHPEMTHPAQWTVETCADFLAVLNRLKVGEWELQSSDNINRRNLGEPLGANSKRSVLSAVRGFFRDIQHWGWVKLKFNPIYHLATPTSILRLCGPNPRAVDDNFWLKLVWASLHLEQGDKLSEIWYPIEMLRAISVVWTHAGLRQNEIARLHVGCARLQADPIVDDKTGKIIAPETLCYLDVPAGKTFTAFTKPVSAIVRQYVSEWEAIRPEQPTLLDVKTGERVRFLFQYRGKLIGSSTINQTIVPMLCAKAGLPLEDSRGKITSHRGRASAVTALASVPQGMSLIELMQWAGHRSPKSTLYYIRTKPTQLAGAFAKADQMAHLIEVLVDHAAVVSGDAAKGEPYRYYDLGSSYCANPFWSTCPHRMACAGCDFNIPKNSAKGEALAAKAFLHRYLEEVPLTPDEQLIVKGDLKKLEIMLERLKDVPALDGRTPRQIQGD
jgi:Phage integrase family